MAHRTLAAGLLLAAAVSLSAQGTATNYNLRYRFPLSLGVEYQNLSPFANYGAQFNIYDISANLRWPIPSLPVLQPTVKAGIVRFDSLDPADPLRWDHTHWYGALGLVAAHRFSKNFEIGAEALSGFSEAVFPHLVPNGGAVGTQYLWFEGGGQIALNPSYSFSVQVHPSLKYLMSLGALKDFDGLIFGIGFSVGFRLGQDPDLAANSIRAIRFGEVQLPPAFAAMQSYYAKNPLGQLTLTNTDRQTLTDVQVSFFQAGYMDSPTPAATLRELPGGATQTVGLLALFNQEVFKTEGVTPLTGEVIVNYNYRGRPVEQRQAVSYELRDKTALSWDDDRKVAAFITPADSALRNYASFIRQAAKEAIVPALNEPLQEAMQVYSALAEIGLLYQADPASPFTKVQGDPRVVDSISLPRDTLKRITGDCDDLTVLYSSLLETIGVETGFITVPGHIYSVFNTKVPAAEFASLHPDRGLTINLNGSLWVPVEITLIGQAGFLEAWRRGIDEWRELEASPERRGFNVTREAQVVYQPVGLKEADLGLQYGRPEQIARSFARDLDKLVDAVVGELAAKAQSKGQKTHYNRLGLAYARFARYEQARSAFSKALQLDPGYLGAQINLANLLYLQKNYSGALSGYEAAWKTIQRQGNGKSELAGKLLLNLANTYYQLDKFNDAKSFYSLARDVNQDQAQVFAYLGQAPESEARAAEQENIGNAVIFIEEEAKP
jgi:tetratricopeptide (TPR) repeat protein